MLKAIYYTPGEGWREVTDLSVISNLCDQSGARIWAEADVSTLIPTDVATIAEEFGLHELAVEDATEARERPKLEEYDKHLFSVIHELQEKDDQLEAAQIACFVGTRYVLVLHAHAARTIAETERRLRATKGEIWGGSAFLMHTLLDTVVDDYERLADSIEQDIESVEDQLLRDPLSSVMTQLYTVKQRVARFRRYAFPVSRMLATVVEQGSLGASIRLVDRHFGTYFRDIHDHTIRVADQLRNVEDLTDALINLARTEQATSQNEAVKRVSGWAAIIAIPTLVASIYGMNFSLVPKHGSLFGFWFAIGLMLAIGVALYLRFKRSGWL